jgi:glycine/D-amino acid oxidase-like deaminating enzyme
MATSGMEAKQGEFSKMPVVYWFESYHAWSTKHTFPHHMTHDENFGRVTRHAYGKRSPSGNLFFGGDRFFPDHDADYEVNNKALDELFKKKIYPSLPSLSKFFSHDEAGSWAGIMPFSKDGYATIDCLDGEGLFVATGFGASGIMDAPGAMFFLADWLRGNEKHPYLKKFEKRPS